MYGVKKKSLKENLTKRIESEMSPTVRGPSCLNLTKRIERK